MCVFVCVCGQAAVLGLSSGGEQERQHLNCLISPITPSQAVRNHTHGHVNTHTHSQTRMHAHAHAAPENPIFSAEMKKKA